MRGAAQGVAISVLAWTFPDPYGPGTIRDKRPAMPDIACHLDAYRTHGFTVIPDLLAGDTVERLRRVTDALLESARETDAETDILELEPDHSRAAPRVRRIKTPHRAHPAYWELARDPTLLRFVAGLIGENIRLSHSKINTKPGGGGEAIEWHQDWAFAPHSNMDMCIAAVLLDDCTPENGPLQILPGSHRGRLHEHHGEDGYFQGAIDVGRAGLTVAEAVAVLGRAGTVSLHHPMSVHGSARNRSGAPRRMMFLEYAAADAWPLFYGPDWDEYMSRIVSGRATSLVRSEPVFVKQPFPTRAPGSIFNSQTQFAAPFFEAVAG